MTVRSHPASPSSARRLIGRLLFAVLGYLAVVIGASWLAAQLPAGVSRDDATRAAVVGLFLLLLAASLGVSGEARTFLGQQLRVREGQGRWLAFSALAGLLFYAGYVALSGLDLDRIGGWRFDLRFVLVFIVLSALMIPFVEEFFFRAVAIADARGARAGVAALLSAAAFALVHPDRWASVFVFALVAAALYRRAGLLAAYAFHAAYNLANFLLLLAVSGTR